MLTKNQATARTMLYIMVFLILVAWCVYWVPEPWRWLVVLWAFVVCPAAVVVIIALKNRRERAAAEELYTPPQPEKLTRKTLQLRIEHSSGRGGRKFA